MANARESMMNSFVLDKLKLVQRCDVPNAEMRAVFIGL